MTRLRRAILAVAVAVAIAPAPARSDGAIALGSVADVFAHLGNPNARTIVLAAYSLGPRARITTALAAAGDRGAHVSVLLGRGAFGNAAQDNADTAALLGAHHVSVRATAVDSHLKAALIDGELYLTDRNFASSVDEGIVVRDSFPGDRALVESALLGRAGGNDHLWTRKGDALAAEARVLRVRRSATVDVATENFGGGTPVFAALLERRRAGDTVRLLVAQREYEQSAVEQHAVAALCMARIEVRLSDANEKFAVDGDDAWIGSANATRGLPDQIDFGLALRDGGLAAELARRFAGEWARATPLTRCS